MAREINTKYSNTYRCTIKLMESNAGLYSIQKSDGTVIGHTFSSENAAQQEFRKIT